MQILLTVSVGVANVDRDLFGACFAKTTAKLSVKFAFQPERHCEGGKARYEQRDTVRSGTTKVRGRCCRPEEAKEPKQTHGSKNAQPGWLP